MARQRNEIRRKFTKSLATGDGKTKMLSWRAEIETIRSVYLIADHMTEKHGRFFSLAETMRIAVQNLAKTELGDGAEG